MPQLIIGSAMMVMLCLGLFGPWVVSFILLLAYGACIGLMIVKIINEHQKVNEIDLRILRLQLRVEEKRHR